MTERVKVTLNGKPVPKDISLWDALEINAERKAEEIERRKVTRRSIREKYRNIPEAPGPVKKLTLQEGIDIYGFKGYPSLGDAEKVLYILNSFKGYDIFYTLLDILRTTGLRSLNEAQDLITAIESKLNSFDGRVFVIKKILHGKEFGYKINHHMRISLEELIRIWRK